MADSDATAAAAEDAIVPEPEVIDGEVAENGAGGAMVPHDAQGLTEQGLVPSRNYAQAVELGKVLAASGYYADARDPAKAAVKVMIGMDMGVSPTAALSAIHIIESEGRLVPLVEGKLLAGIIKARPGYDYEVVEYSIEKVTLRFLRGGHPLEPDITWTAEDTQRAQLGGKRNHQRYPRQMNFWRAIAEGVRMHFPEIIGGQPIYAQEEFGDGDEALAKALEPGKPAALTDEQAEEQRKQARAIYDELKEINPERVPPGRFAQMVSNAEHSHEQLANLIGALEGLRDSERRYKDLSAEIAERIPADAYKALIGRAERRGSNQERIELLEEALAAAGDPEQVEAPEGSEQEPGAGAEG